MNERDAFRKAFSALHASEHTIEEVLNMADKNKAAFPKGRKIGKTALIAAAMVVALAATAFGAGYAVNYSNIMFFDTLKDMAAAQQKDGSETASYASPGSARHNEQEMETVAETIAHFLERGYHGEETLLSDETDDPAETMWERRRVTECLHEDYGRITSEYRTGTAYAGQLVVEGLLDWDLSSLAENMTPDEGGQLLLTSRDRTGKLVMAEALLGYTTVEGKRFQIEYNYDADSRYLQETEYILSSEYDDCYLYTTSDQVEVLIEAYDGQIWASAVNVKAGNAVHLYTTGCMASEIEAILDGLHLADVMNAGL